MACSCLASSLLSLLEFSTTFVVVAFQVCLWSYRDICGFIYFLRGGKKVLACILTQGKSKISLSPGFSALQLANSVAFG